MKKYIKKYVSYIVGYVIYASLALIAIIEHHNEFWELFLFWLITIPLIVGCIIYFIRKRHKKSAKASVSISSNENNLFIENWPLLDFAKKYGPEMKVGTFTNKNTGEEYRVCVFIRENGKRTYVRFFSQLGELTPFEISQRKNDLKVGITEADKFYLHDNNVKIWETVNL